MSKRINRFNYRSSHHVRGSVVAPWKNLNLLLKTTRRFRLSAQYRQKEGIRFENTYCLDPVRKFKPSRAEPVLWQILEKHLQGRSYEPCIQPVLTKTITDEIKGCMKALNYPRYRYVVHMTVGQKQSQDLRVASRCVWDTDRDDYASYTFESNTDLFAVATVFAIYSE